MKFAEYNSFPENMVEMNDRYWEDFFTYGVTETERRQAYRETPYELATELEILWVRKERGLGVCISRKRTAYGMEPEFYRVGTQEEWDRLKSGTTAMCAGDNS